MDKLKRWKERHYTDTNCLYVHAENSYITGVVGTDIKLTLWERIQILFCGGISVVLHGHYK